MSSNALVQTRIDAEVKERASAVLDRMGLTVSDVVRILLTRVANEGVLPPGFAMDEKTYDVWFRRKVQEALHDTRADISDEEASIRFAERRAVARRKADGEK